jgi:hypothetical protein
MLSLAVFMIVLGLLLISAGLSVAQATPVSAGRYHARHHHAPGRPLTTPVSAGHCSAACRTGLQNRHRNPTVSRRPDATSAPPRGSSDCRDVCGVPIS